MMRQPALFIPHGGGPCFFMEWNPPHIWDKMAAYLQSIASTLPQKPAAMVVISAHWEEAEFTVQSVAQPDLIYDYSGFPPHTYQLEYKAPGVPALAARVVELLEGAGITARTNTSRGYDHGVFIPLKVAFPAADIPIVQLSLKRGLDPAAHVAMGRALAPLRDENILIVGSGMTFHNMRVLMSRFSGDLPPDAQAAAFDTWLGEAATSATPDTALNAWASAPSARYAHPHEEHLLPLMVVAGAANGDAGQKTLHDLSLGVDISAFRFG